MKNTLSIFILFCSQIFAQDLVSTDEIPVNPGVESITSFEVYYESEEPITSFMFTINLDNNVWEDQNTVTSYLGSGYMIGSGYENTNPTVSLNALSGGAAEDNGFKLSVSHSGNMPDGETYCLDCAIVSGSSNGSSIPSGNGLLLTLEGQNVSLDGICVTAAYGESWNLDIGCVSIQECNTIVFSQYWDDCMWSDAAGYAYHPYAGLTNTTIIDTDDTDLTNITITDNDVVNEGDIDDDDLDTQIIPLDLPEGWSMFGYTCVDSVDALVGFSDLSDKIEIVSLQVSEGYQIKMIEEVTDFQFCEAIVPDDGITQVDVDAAVAEIEASYEGWIAPVYGCTGPDHCNYNPLANTDDGSCVYAQEGYDCDGNEIVVLQIGDQHAGGIVFQINEDGTGLVAALEDIGGIEWGCFGTLISGADGQAIGTGYQNTLDIVAGCLETPIAASEALAYESEGYSDWFLPSINEMLEMYYTIGNGGPEGNIGGFEETGYWSSSEYNNNSAWVVSFAHGYATVERSKFFDFRVRVIRAF